MVVLSKLCEVLDIARYRVDQWLARGIFRPEKNTTSGKARVFTLKDAIALSVLKELADAQFSLESISAALANLHGFEDEKAILVISFEDRTLAIDGQPSARIPGLLTAHVMRKSKLLDHISSEHCHVSLVVDLDRHAARMKHLFPDQ